MRTGDLEPEQFSVSSSSSSMRQKRGGERESGLENEEGERESGGRERAIE